MIDRVLAFGVLVLVVILGFWLKGIAITNMNNTSAKATEEAIKHDLKNLNDFTNIFIGDYIGGVLHIPEETSGYTDTEYDHSYPRASGKEPCNTPYGPVMGDFEHPTETESYEEDVE